MNKEDIELAGEHIKIAEDLVSKNAKESEDETEEKKLTHAELDLEKAEAELDELTE